MGRKSNRQRIKDQLDKAITIGQLIDVLKGMPADTYVGRAGHFGEAHLMTKYDFSYIRTAYVTPSGFWQGGNEQNINILDMCVPDIGPDPD